MDSSRTPRRVQRLPARPFDVVGTNGVPQLPQASRLNIPSLNVEDRSAEYLERANQSVFTAFDYQQQAIESTRQADEIEARNGTSTGFASTFRDIAVGLQQGVSAYAQYRQSQQDEQARLQAILSEEEAARQQELDARLGAEFENDIRTKAIELRESFYNNGLDNSSVVVMREWLNEQRRLVLERGLSPEVAQAITNIGFQTLDEVQQQFGERTLDNQTNLRNEMLGQQVNQLYQEVADDVFRLTQNPSSTQGFASVMNDVNTAIGEFFEGKDFDPLTVLQITNEVYGRLSGSIDQSLQNYYGFAEQKATLNNVLLRAAQVQQQYFNNPTRMNAEFLALELELQRAGVNIQLSETFQNQGEYLREQLEMQRLIGDINSNQMPPQLSIEAQQRADIVNTQTAYQWFINTPANQYAIERARRPDASSQETATLALYESLEEARVERENIRQRIRQANADKAQIEADLEQVYDSFAPTERLGQPVLEDQYLRALVELAGTERGRMSTETAAAFERLAEVEVAGVLDRLATALNEEAALLSEWLAVGINLDDQKKTIAELDARAAEALEWLRVNNENLMNSPPMSLSGVPLVPSTFLQGLPQLPDRQSP